jgi:hypothetical protein
MASQKEQAPGWFDRYGLFARLFPAILVALPVYVSWFYAAGLIGLIPLGHFLESQKILGVLSISVVVLFFYSQMLRLLGKRLEEKYFKNGLEFPSVSLLLYADERMSESFKDGFREKVKGTLGLEPPSRLDEEEDLLMAKRRLREIIRMVIAKCRGRGLVLQHNIQYGFIRNLLGGAPLGIVLAVIFMLLGKLVVGSTPMLILNGCLAALYGFLLVLKRPLLQRAAREYAEQLLGEFLVFTDADALRKN